LLVQAFFPNSYLHQPYRTPLPRFFFFPFFLITAAPRSPFSLNPTLPLSPDLRASPPSLRQLSPCTTFQVSFFKVTCRSASALCFFIIKWPPLPMLKQSLSPVSFFRFFFLTVSVIHVGSPRSFNLLRFFSSRAVHGCPILTAIYLTFLLFMKFRHAGPFSFPFFFFFFHPILICLIPMEAAQPRLPATASLFLQ